MAGLRAAFEAASAACEANPSDRAAEAELFRCRSVCTFPPTAFVESLQAPASTAFLRFQALAALREVCLREWAVSPPADRCGMRSFLLQFAAQHVSELPDYVTSSALQTVAILLKRGWVEEEATAMACAAGPGGAQPQPSAAAQLLNSAVSAAASSSDSSGGASQHMCLRLLSLVVSEFLADAKTSSAMGLSLTDHAAAYERFQDSPHGLISVFSAAVSAINIAFDRATQAAQAAGNTSPQPVCGAVQLSAAPALAGLVKTGLAVCLQCLSWDHSKASRLTSMFGSRQATLRKVALVAASEADDGDDGGSGGRGPVLCPTVSASRPWQNLLPSHSVLPVFFKIFEEAPAHAAAAAAGSLGGAARSGSGAAAALYGHSEVDVAMQAIVCLCGLSVPKAGAKRGAQGGVANHQDPVFQSTAELSAHVATCVQCIGTICTKINGVAGATLIGLPGPPTPSSSPAAAVAGSPPAADGPSGLGETLLGMGVAIAVSGDASNLRPPGSDAEAFLSVAGQVVLSAQMGQADALLGYPLAAAGTHCIDCVSRLLATHTARGLVSLAGPAFFSDLLGVAAATTRTLLRRGNVEAIANSAHGSYDTAEEWLESGAGTALLFWTGLSTEVQELQDEVAAAAVDGAAAAAAAQAAAAQAAAATPGAPSMFITPEQLAPLVASVDAAVSDVFKMFVEAVLQRAELSCMSDDYSAEEDAIQEEFITLLATLGRRGCGVCALPLLAFLLGENAAVSAAVASGQQAAAGSPDLGLLQEKAFLLVSLATGLLGDPQTHSSVSSARCRLPPAVVAASQAAAAQPASCPVVSLYCTVSAMVSTFSTSVIQQQQQQQQQHMPMFSPLNAQCLLSFVERTARAYIPPYAASLPAPAEAAAARQGAVVSLAMDTFFGLQGVQSPAGSGDGLVQAQQQRTVALLDAAVQAVVCALAAFPSEPAVAEQAGACLDCFAQSPQFRCILWMCPCWRGFAAAAAAATGGQATGGGSGVVFAAGGPGGAAADPVGAQMFSMLCAALPALPAKTQKMIVSAAFRAAPFIAADGCAALGVPYSLAEGHQHQTVVTMSLLGPLQARWDLVVSCLGLTCFQPNLPATAGAQAVAAAKADVCVTLALTRGVACAATSRNVPLLWPVLQGALSLAVSLLKTYADDEPTVKQALRTARDIVQRTVLHLPDAQSLAMYTILVELFDTCCSGSGGGGGGGAAAAAAGLANSPSQTKLLLQTLLAVSNKTFMDWDPASTDAGANMAEELVLSGLRYLSPTIAADGAALLSVPKIGQSFMSLLSMAAECYPEKVVGMEEGQFANTMDSLAHGLGQVDLDVAQAALEGASGLVSYTLQTSWSAGGPINGGVQLNSSPAYVRLKQRLSALMRTVFSLLVVSGAFNDARNADRAADLLRGLFAIDPHDTDGFFQCCVPNSSPNYPAFVTLVGCLLQTSGYNEVGGGTKQHRDAFRRELATFVGPARGFLMRI